MESASLNENVFYDHTLWQKSILPWRVVAIWNPSLGEGKALCRESFSDGSRCRRLKSYASPWVNRMWRCLLFPSVIFSQCFSLRKVQTATCSSLSWWSLLSPPKLFIPDVYHWLLCLTDNFFLIILYESVEQPMEWCQPQATIERPALPLILTFSTAVIFKHFFSVMRE